MYALGKNISQRLGVHNVYPCADPYFIDETLLHDLVPVFFLSVEKTRKNCKLSTKQCSSDKKNLRKPYFYSVKAQSAKRQRQTDTMNYRNTFAV